MVIEIIPDAWNSFVIFRALSTQWRTGFNGPTGLDYSCIPQVISMMGIKGDLAAIFSDIRVMERAALAVIYKG